jgi:predicted RNA-binding protein with TRAM domain
MSFGERGSGNGNRGGFGGGEGAFRSFKPKPVEVGKEYDVTIAEMSGRGDGIAKIDGFVIFVAGAKQGQTARVKVTQVSSRFATGTVVEGSATTPTTAPATAGVADPAEIAEEMEESDE